MIFYWQALSGKDCDVEIYLRRWFQDPTRPNLHECVRSVTRIPWVNVLKVVDFSGEVTFYPWHQIRRLELHKYPKAPKP